MTAEGAAGSPACGDFRIAEAAARALGALAIQPKDVFWVGCSAVLPGGMRTYGFHGPKGRSLPVALGAKLANPSLTVLVTIEAGGAGGTGLAHLLYAARRDIGVTCVVVDDSGGPPSSGPAALALQAGATFAARVPAGDRDRLEAALMEAIPHPGFALVEYAPAAPGDGRGLGILHRDPGSRIRQERLAGVLQGGPAVRPRALSPLEREELLNSFL